MLEHLSEHVAFEHRGRTDEAAHHTAHQASGDDIRAGEVETFDRCAGAEPALLEAFGGVSEAIDRAVRVGGEVRRGERRRQLGDLDLSAGTGRVLVERVEQPLGETLL